MKPHILAAYPFSAEFMQKLATCASVSGPVDLRTSDWRLTADAAKATILVTIGAREMSAALMDELPSLRLICCYGSGYEGVDLEHAKKRGIKVTHSPGANAAAVAELAIGLLLAASRQIVAADRTIRDGRWADGSAAPTPAAIGLSGRRIGIFGMGAIGRKIAQYLSSFDCELAYCSRSPKPDISLQHHLTLQSLVEWADVLIVAARADKSNRHVVGADAFRSLGPNGIVVNIARGSLLDEGALIAALEAGRLGSAGLDVFEREPFVSEPLKRLPQIVLTPHIGGRTTAAELAMQTMVISNITAFLAGEPILTPVTDWL